MTDTTANATEEMVSVPREPTLEMIEAGGKALNMAHADIFPGSFFDIATRRELAREVLRAGLAHLNLSSAAHEKLWCETCGEAEQVVHTKHAGLCGGCWEAQGRPE